MHSYTVTAVTPSKVKDKEHEALVWLGDAEFPYRKSKVWDIRRHGGFPEVGMVVKV